MMKQTNNEQARLTALERLEIMDTPPEPEFDELVEVAAAICDVPISMVTLVDAHRQWFKAVIGLDSRGSSREVAFCAYAIEQPDIMTVEDATCDPRFAQNPLVTCERGIRFYAGVPLNSADGHAVGTLCVIDRVPRTLTKTQMTALRVLGRQANARLEMREHRRALEIALAETEEARSRLAASERRFKEFADSSPFLSFLKDKDGRMVFYNRHLAEHFGKSRTEMLGKTDAELWPPEFARTFRAHDLQVLHDGKPSVVEETSPNADGSTTYWRSYKFPCHDVDGSLLLGGISVDVTEERRHASRLQAYQAELESANARLRELATTDPLTGLANRRVFDERLAVAFVIARRNERPLSVIFLDIDNFKQCNDAFGHAVGDNVLQRVAQILCRAVRVSDLVVRYGGEEFVLLLPETGEAEALILGERILKTLREESFEHGPITLSGGVAALNDATLKPRDMMRLADTALYEAKHTGKDCVLGCSGLGVTRSPWAGR